MRLVQLRAEGARRVGAVDGERLRLVSGTSSVRELALEAASLRTSLEALVLTRLGDESVGYDEALREGRILVPLDHPDPSHLCVSGTGLTHTGSAHARDGMHQKLLSSDASELTHSLRLFRRCLEDGKPADGGPGVQPEWFFKGNGHTVIAPGLPLPVPSFTLDAGEEAEIVGLYVVDDDGTPCRVGFALGNELSDHVTERENYLYLAHSKLRPCSFGPELLLGELPAAVKGWTRIRRDGRTLWERTFESGESHMTHRISGLEHHHFKYAAFRVPGDVHVHFFGADVISYADGITTRAGDVVEIECPAFGKPLSNALVREDAGAFELRVL